MGMNISWTEEENSVNDGDYRAWTKEDLQRAQDYLERATSHLHAATSQFHGNEMSVAYAVMEAAKSLFRMVESRLFACQRFVSLLLSQEGVVGGPIVDGET